MTFKAQLVLSRTGHVSNACNTAKYKEMIIDLKNNKHVFSPVVVDEKELAVIIVPNF